MPCKALYVLLTFAALMLPAAHAEDGPAAESAPTATDAPQAESALLPNPAQPERAAPASAPSPSSPERTAPAPVRAMPEAATSAPGNVAPPRKSSHPPARRTAPAKRAPAPSQTDSRKHRSAEARDAKKKATEDRENRNPILEAINLVASTQQDEIKAADEKVSESDWWSDTLDREWIVKRPFGPGIFDSTHWFYVSYKVNGRILMSWFVDLNKGTVSDVSPPERHSSR
jgi:hypothetical protein